MTSMIFASTGLLKINLKSCCFSILWR